MVKTKNKSYQKFVHSKTEFQTINCVMYRHSSIYAVNVGTQKKKGRSKNRINRGYLVGLKGRKIG